MLLYLDLNNLLFLLDGEGRGEANVPRPKISAHQVRLNNDHGLLELLRGSEEDGRRREGQCQSRTCTMTPSALAMEEMEHVNLRLSEMEEVETNEEVRNAGA